MAGYRQFHTQFWKDEWLIELDPLERYLFSYLFTNDLSSISGIYKLPMRVIINETGLEKEFVVFSLAKFQDAKKIFYKDGVMWVVNMKKYHKNASPRTMVKVNSDIEEIPDCDVKTAYLYYEKTGQYCIDTVSIPRTESVSRIVSERESERGSSASSLEDLPEGTVISESQAVRIFTEVTSFVAIPAMYDTAVNAICELTRKKGGKIIPYLKPFFQAQTLAKTKTKRPYPRTAMYWLCEWAVGGEIPAYVLEQMTGIPPDDMPPELLTWMKEHPYTPPEIQPNGNGKPKLTAEDLGYVRAGSTPT